MNAAFAGVEYQGRVWFAAAEVGYHSERADCPEVCFGEDRLARLRIGLRFKL